MLHRSVVVEGAVRSKAASRCHTPSVLQLRPTLMVGLSESPGWRVSPGASQFHPTNTLEAFCCYTCHNSLQFHDNSMQEACISSEF